MTDVSVKYKFKVTANSPYTTHNSQVSINSKSPTESAVLAHLKHCHPSWQDIVLLEMKVK